MASVYLDRLNELEKAVISSPASLSAAVRRQILQHARDGAHRQSREQSLPVWVEELAHAVVTTPASANVDGHLEQGRSETEIFEVVVVAAVGAALARADKLLPALRNEP